MEKGLPVGGLESAKRKPPDCRSAIIDCNGLTGPAFKRNRLVSFSFFSAAPESADFRLTMRVKQKYVDTLSNV